MVALGFYREKVSSRPFPLSTCQIEACVPVRISASLAFLSKQKGLLSRRKSTGYYVWFINPSDARWDVRPQQYIEEIPLPQRTTELGLQTAKQPMLMQRRVEGTCRVFRAAHSSNGQAEDLFRFWPPIAFSVELTLCWGDRQLEPFPCKAYTMPSRSPFKYNKLVFTLASLA